MVERMNSMTLTAWQTIEKPRSELFYNCSEFDRLNDEWVPFSIGLGWSIIQNPTPLKDLQVGSHNELVLCAINAGTDQRRRGSQPINRRTILNTLSKNGIHNTYFQSAAYFNVLPHYKFIISPEGNGIDCHRHYEALMAGCIPIIEEHEGIREKYKSCPVLYTKDYSEITPVYLEKVYESMKNEVYDFSRLLLSTYSSEEQGQIKSNGNYWSHRLSGKYWYS
jgi:hypothetical protein